MADSNVPEVASAALRCNGVFLPLEADNWVLRRWPVVLLDSGAEQERFVGIDDDLGLEATIVRETYPDSPVVRQWLEVRNIGGTGRCASIASIASPWPYRGSAGRGSTFAAAGARSSSRRG